MDADVQKALEKMQYAIAYADGYLSELARARDGHTGDGLQGIVKDLQECFTRLITALCDHEWAWDDPEGCGVRTCTKCGEERDLPEHESLVSREVSP